MSQTEAGRALKRDVKLQPTNLKMTGTYKLPNFTTGFYNCSKAINSCYSVVRIVAAFLWSPYVIGQTIYIFMLWFVLLLSSFFSSPNLSRRRLDVCHTSTHGVALVRI